MAKITEKKYSYEYAPKTSLLSRPTDYQKGIIQDAEDGALAKFYNYDEGGNYFEFNDVEFKDHKKDIVDWLNKHPEFEIIKGTFEAIYGAKDDYDADYIKHPNDKYIYLMTSMTDGLDDLQTKSYTYEPKENEIIVVNKKLDESNLNEWSNSKSPLDYIEDKLQDANIDYTVEQAMGDEPYDTWITINDGQDISADDIICSVVGYAYEWVRDKYGNRKYCKVVTDEDTIQELNESLKGNHSFKGLTKKVVVEAKETCSQDYLRYKRQLQKAKTIDELRKVWQNIKKDLDDDMSFEEDKKLSNLFLERKKELNEKLKEAKDTKDTLYLVRTKSGVFEVKAKNDDQAVKQARLMQDEPVERIVNTTTNKVVFNLEENLQEGWVQFTFEDGSNPYVAKTKEEQDRMLKKYKGRVEQVGDITYLVKSDKKKTNESFDEKVKYAVVYRNREDGSLIDAKVYDDYSKASALYQTELAKRDLDPSIEVDIEDVTPESSLWEESLDEDKQVTYVWKKDGDDHILTKKGDNKALITLSRMNSGFPWTVYKGDKEITLDNDSDKLSDIKAYILKNVDKILGTKLKEDRQLTDNERVEKWLKPMILGDTLEQQPFISITYTDQDESVVATTRWETTPRKAHSDYIETREFLGDKYNISVLRQENRDNNKQFAYVMRITPKTTNENLDEAKGKLDDALPELEKYVNEYKDKLVEYGQALAKGEVARPDYKDFTTRFIFDIYYLFKRRGLNLGKYIDENELQDKYIGTLMKKALTNCGVKITKDEYLNESLDTFDDKMDFLAKDEDEAIDGYKKVIKTVDNKNVKAQLKKIETEEKAHKDYLERVKKNKNIKYTEPLDEE